MTDRPDQTESAVVVPAGAIQLESGFTFAAGGDGGADTRVLEGPGTLVRFGLGHRAELRMAWDGWIGEDSDGDSPGDANRDVDGIGDGALGAKVRLREEVGALPEAALLVGVSLPIGDDELSSDRFDPALRLAFAHDLGRGTGLAYNLGLEWTSEPTAAGARETFSRFVYTVALGTSLSERLGAFVEAFGSAPLDSPAGSEASLDGGLTFLVRPRLQLDLSAGTGVTGGAVDWFVGTGASVRWPR